MGEIMELLNQIITIEDEYGDYTTEDYLAIVINKAEEIKAKLEDL